MVSRLPSYSDDAGLLIDGVGEAFSLTTVDGLRVDFYGFYLPYMNNGASVNKVGKGESWHDRIAVAEKNAPVFSTGDIVENETHGRFMIQNHPRPHLGIIWLELIKTTVSHGGTRGMYDAG